MSYPSPSRYTRCSRNDATPRSSVSVTSTKCVGRGAAFTAARRTPDHGSRPSSSSSGNTQRFPASRAASSAARPTSRWSAMFRPPKPHRSSKFESTSTSGRCRRIARARSRRSSSPPSITPSRWVEELDGVDTDERGAGALLVPTERSRLGGVHAVDARLTRGREQVTDPLPAAGPARDGARGAVLEIVGVRDDRERTVPVLGERCQRGIRHVTAHPRTHRRVAPATRTGSARSPPASARCAPRPGRSPATRGSTGPRSRSPRTCRARRR